MPSVVIVILLLAVTGPAAAVDDKKAQAKAEDILATDPETGLVMDEHWRIVAAHCGACHSTRLVTQNRGDRETWLGLIRWMQETQGLWPLNKETETQILDYLETHYGPLATARRKPLPPSLMPPKPANKD